MEQLAKSLDTDVSFRSIGRPVLNRTDLTGSFSFDLEFTPGSLAATPADGAGTNDAGASIFTALQELGLKLESTRGPVDLVVIDHVERPTDN